MPSFIALWLLALSLPADAGAASCSKNHDCVVVYDSWCNLPQAIMQANLSQWIEDDKKHYVIAKEARQTCKASNDFPYYAYCENGECRAKFLAIDP